MNKMDTNTPLDPPATRDSLHDSFPLLFQSLESDVASHFESESPTVTSATASGPSTDTSGSSRPSVTSSASLPILPASSSSSPSQPNWASKFDSSLSSLHTTPRAPPVSVISASPLASPRPVSAVSPVRVLTPPSPLSRPQSPWALSLDKIPNLPPPSRFHRSSRSGRSRSLSPARAYSDPRIQTAPPITAPSQPQPPTMDSQILSKPIVLSPPSFLMGIAVGVLLVILKPTFEFYMDRGATLLMSLLKYSLIWGSMGLGVFGIIHLFRAQSTPVPAPKPRSTRKNSAPRTPSPVKSRTRSVVDSPTMSIDEGYSYRPYAPRNRPPTPPHLQIYSGEDISILEKPAGDSAFRMSSPRHLVY